MDNSLHNGVKLAGGKYTIIRSLGKGTFGITYQANMVSKVSGELGDMDVNVSVAIKEFFMSDMNNRGIESSLVEGSESSIVVNYRRKFRKEAENLSHLKHDNIVKVLDIFDENNTTYYVMQFIDGKSLDQYIQENGTISETEAIEIINKVGSALQYMHDNRMLHLDLKPGNIMYGKDGRVTLIDFGLSKQYDSKGEPESSTSLGLGTPGYAPIEQADYRQDGSFPATLDVYALGATMFKMLTGVRPPASSSMLTPDDFPESLFVRQGVSDNTIAAVKKAMSPSRRNRYQTVRAFLDALNYQAYIPENNNYNAFDSVKTIPYYQNTSPNTQGNEKTIVSGTTDSATMVAGAAYNPTMVSRQEDAPTIINTTVSGPANRPTVVSGPQDSSTIINTTVPTSRVTSLPEQQYVKDSQKGTKDQSPKKKKIWIFIVIGVAVTLAIIVALVTMCSHNFGEKDYDILTDSVSETLNEEDTIITGASTPAKLDEKAPQGTPNVVQENNENTPNNNKPASSNNNMSNNNNKPTGYGNNNPTTTTTSPTPSDLNGRIEITTKGQLFRALTWNNIFDFDSKFVVTSSSLNRRKKDLIKWAKGSGYDDYMGKYYKVNSMPISDGEKLDMLESEYGFY